MELLRILIERTDAPLMKGDMILTTLKIERDDAGIGYLEQWKEYKV